MDKLLFDCESSKHHKFYNHSFMVSKASLTEDEVSSYKKDFKKIGKNLNSSRDKKIMQYVL